MTVQTPRPVLVFFGCTDKTVDKVGNNNEYTYDIFGIEPILIRLSFEELGWAARGPLGDESYAEFLRMIVDTAAAKKGVHIAGQPSWKRDVKILMFGHVFDEADKSAREMLKRLFPKARCYKSDPYANIEPIWRRERRRKPAPTLELDPSDPRLLEPIDDMEMGVRAYNCLKRSGYQTVGDLVARSATELRSMLPNFGKKSVEEVQEALAMRGLFLRVD